MSNEPIHQLRLNEPGCFQPPKEYEASLNQQQQLSNEKNVKQSNSPKGFKEPIGFQQTIGDVQNQKEQQSFDKDQTFAQSNEPSVFEILEQKDMGKQGSKAQEFKWSDLNMEGWSGLKETQESRQLKESQIPQQQQQFGKETQASNKIPVKKIDLSDRVAQNLKKAYDNKFVEEKQEGQRLLSGGETQESAGFKLAQDDKALQQQNMQRQFGRASQLEQRKGDLENLEHQVPKGTWGFDQFKKQDKSLPGQGFNISADQTRQGLGDNDNFMQNPEEDYTINIQKDQTSGPWMRDDRRSRELIKEADAPDKDFNMERGLQQDQDKQKEMMGGIGGKEQIKQECTCTDLSLSYSKSANIPLQSNIVAGEEEFDITDLEHYDLYRDARKVSEESSIENLTRRFSNKECEIHMRSPSPERHLRKGQKQREQLNQQKQQEIKIQQIPKKTLSSEEEGDEYADVGRWHYQKDRTHIDDGFDQGDLERSFDEKEVLEHIDVPEKHHYTQQEKIKHDEREMHHDDKNLAYKGRWKWQKDRTHIDDGFEGGDLNKSFDESKVKDHIDVPEKWHTDKQAEMRHNQHMQKRDEKNFAYQGRWKWQKNRKNIFDGFEEGDLASLFDESQVQYPEKYEKIGRWRFQTDRSHIFDGFQEGDLAKLFDESCVLDRWEIPEKYQLNDQQMLLRRMRRRKHADYERNMVYWRRWKWQKNRKNIFDGFEQGDLEDLWDESDVLEKWEIPERWKLTPQQLELRGQRRQRRDAYERNLIYKGKWKWQKDRSNIFDGFEEGDLCCLFDESQVLDKIERYSKRDFESYFYGQYGRWRYQFDRANIDDGFEEGDLEALFDESRVQAQFKRQQRGIWRDELNRAKVGRWSFQIDRSKIFDGFERMDLPRLFSEFRVQPVILDKQKQPPIDLKMLRQEKERMRRQQKKDKLKEKQQQMFSQKSTSIEGQSLSFSRFDMFGDPYNLQKKNEITSEDHLIKQSECKLNDFFNRISAPKQKSLQERMKQSRLDKQRAAIEKQKKFEEEERLRWYKEEQDNLRKQENIMRQQHKTQISEEPKLTLNQKKKLKRRQRKEKSQQWDQMMDQFAAPSNTSDQLKLKKIGAAKASLEQRKLNQRQFGGAFEQMAF